MHPLGAYHLKAYSKLLGNPQKGIKDAPKLLTIITQTVTTAHQLSYAFHQPRLCWSQAGIEIKVVVRATLKANRDSKS